MGRKTIKVTRRALEQFLGVTWELARLAALGDLPSLEARLARPILSLRTTIRLDAVIEARGIQTVGDLVRLTPDEIRRRNVGAYTLRDAERILKEFLGMSWGRARHALRGDELAMARKLDLAALGQLDLRPLPIHDVLPVFLARQCERWSIVTMAELESSEGLIEADAPKFLDEIVRTLRELPLDAALSRCSRWDELFTRALERLRPRQVMVLRRFFGLGAERSTLAEIGADLSVTSERVRQIKEHALRKFRHGWQGHVTRRLEAAVGDGVHELARLGDVDDFFRADADALGALARFIDGVLDGKVRVSRVEDALVVSSLLSVVTADDVPGGERAMLAVQGDVRRFLSRRKRPITWTTLMKKLTAEDHPCMTWRPGILRKILEQDPKLRVAQNVSLAAWAPQKT